MKVKLKKQDKYFLQHIENGKWIEYNRAGLTGNAKKAFSLPTKRLAQTWIKPQDFDLLNVKPSELSKAFWILLQRSLREELLKRGMDLYKDFIVIKYDQVK